MGNKRLHALLLMHVHINILHNINLADIVDDFVDITDNRKETFRHFLKIIYSMCRNKLKRSSFSCINISYQIYIYNYITWNCVAFHHLLYNTI